jgi:hypothetical protein
MQIIRNISNLDKLNEYMENIRRLKKENFPIYHYTSLESMMKIVETKSLWATNCQYLNDILETQYFMNMLDNKEDYIEKFKDIFNSIFIISFSEERDSVSMWGNYGKNGVIMEFSIPEFIRGNLNSKIEVIHNGRLQKVEMLKLFIYAIYNNKIIKDILSSEIIFSMKDNISIMELFLSVFAIKDKTYSYEKEIRMIFADTDYDYIQKIENYRIKNNLIIPYLTISFEEKGKLPLKSIMYNPEQNDVMYEESIKRFLRSHGYDIPVIPSKSKIR